MRRLNRLLSMLLCLTLLLSSCNNRGNIPTPNDTPDMVVSEIMGGFFYSTPAHPGDDGGAAYRQARMDALSVLRDKMHRFPNYSQNLTSAYTAYEDNFMAHFSDIEMSQEFQDLLQDMLSQIIAYKSALAAHQSMLKTYADTNAKNEGEQAILDSYSFESAHELYRIHEEYYRLLVSYSTLSATILASSHPDKAASLMETSGLIFESQLTDALAEMAKEYDAIAEIYIHINSGDYYAVTPHMDEAIKHLEKIDDDEQIQNLLNQCRQIKKDLQPPDYLVKVYTDTMGLTQKSSTSLKAGLFTAHAADINEYANAIAAVQFVSDIQTMNKEEAIKKLYDNADEIRKHLEQQSPETLYTYGHMSPTQMMAHYTAEKNDDKTLANQMLEPHKVNLTAQEKKELNLISKLDMLHTAVNGTRMDMFDTSSLQYVTLLTSLSVSIKMNKNFDANTSQRLQDFVNRDLGNLLGDNKNVLLDLLAENQGADYIRVFNDWKDRTMGAQGLNFDIGDILIAFDQLGVTPDEVRSVTDQIFDAMSDEETEENVRSLMRIFNLEAIIDQIMEAIVIIFTLGFVDPSGTVENGTGVQETNSGEIKRTSTFVEGEEKVRTSFYRVEGHYRLDSFKQTSYFAQGIPKEVITYRYGEMESKDVYSYENEQHIHLYTEEYYNGRLLEKKIHNQ